MSLIGSALIGAGSSLISNLFGKKSTDSANQTNMKISQMNNEWSEKMMQKQMDYNTEMWNKEAEYNSAKAQAERLREAGLNPALVMSGSNAGSVSSGNSVGLPSPSGTSVQPYKYDFSGVGNAINSAMQIENQQKLADSQSRFTNMQADYYGAKTMAEIAKLYAETESHTAKTYYQNLMNRYGSSMMNADYINKIRLNQSLEVQILNTIKQGVLMDKQISRYDEQTNAYIADLVASTALKYSQGQLNKEQVKKIISETRGLNLSNREKDAIFDYVVDKADADRFKGYTPWSIGADVFHELGKRINKLFGW